MCNCSKNQTHKEVLEYIQRNRINTRRSEDAALGIGLFLVPAPEIGVLETRTVFVEGISCSECVKRGVNCISYQWIPKGMKTSREGKGLTVNTIEDVKALRGFCETVICGPSGCPMGCWCYDTEYGLPCKLD